MDTSTEDGPALICMPDITGFTNFMVETNLEFSRKIIPPLLRKLVTSNTLNMKVGEIEGDAILFYRFGDLPSFKDLVEQCKSFYFNFTQHLETLKSDFPEEFEKYISPDNLALKIILHAAEMNSTYIEGKVKLIGEDVVVVHKLLKNSVSEPEYILFSEKLLSHYTEEEIIATLHWSPVEKSEDDYESIGSIKYRNITLEPLRNEIKEKQETDISKKDDKEEDKNQ